ncbi:MAG: beta-ribofuranosylaminobenzene 5'-phosphate synthase family protein [Candidatus Altiarchaeota archaeon]
MTKVRVKTPSRLHFGIIDMSGRLGRLYGGIGVALAKPNNILEFKKSKRVAVSGKNGGTVRSYARLFLDAFSLKGGVGIRALETIPEHVGLGSGTQLALAVGTGISELYGLDFKPKEVALMSGRGHVSGVGAAVFRHGGFVVDGGHKSMSASLPPVTFHRDFPKDWEFIVVVPKVGKGFHGLKELEAFANIVPASERTASRISWLLQMRMLPSLVEEDIQAFGKSLVEIDRLVGSYFKGEQSGIYMGDATSDLVDFLLGIGCYGAGQSSWGPTVYALTEKKDSNRIAGGVEKFLKLKRIPAKAFVAAADNKGAIVERL